MHFDYYSIFLDNDKIILQAPIKLKAIAKAPPLVGASIFALFLQFDHPER